MRRADPAFLAVFLGWVAITTSVVALLKGGLYTRGFEGDTLHLLDIVTRMGAGQWPHLDFMTPIGVVSFLPIVLFQGAGMAFGPAVLAAQALVAVLILPGVFWASWTRLPRFWAYLFGAAMIVSVTAIVHSAGELGTSISMHYNRWAWSLALTAALVALLPSEGPRKDLIDGVVIGVALSALALIKATYIAAFAPAILAALLLRRAFGVLGVALAVSAVAVVLVFLVAGPAFVWAYLGDLQAVAASPVRPMPGATIGAVLTQPSYVGGTAAVLAAIVLLRRSDDPVLGTAFLIMFPAWVYVTYQNFSNDPVWLVLVAAVLFARAARTEADGGSGRALQITGMAALMVAVPVLYNYSVSTLRHLATSSEDQVMLLAERMEPTDVFFWAPRSDYVMAQIDLVQTTDAFASYKDVLPDKEPVVFRGEELHSCTNRSGMNAQYQETAGGLRTAGIGPEDGVFVADILQALWLYGPFTPLKGGTPWYYSGLPGIGDAEYLVVPVCALSATAWKTALKEIKAQDIPLEEVERTEIYRLYRIVDQEP